MRFIAAVMALYVAGCSAVSAVQSITQPRNQDIIDKLDQQLLRERPHFFFYGEGAVASVPLGDGQQLQYDIICRYKNGKPTLIDSMIVYNSTNEIVTSCEMTTTQASTELQGDCMESRLVHVPERLYPDHYGAYRKCMDGLKMMKEKKIPPNKRKNIQIALR